MRQRLQPVFHVYAQALQVTIDAGAEVRMEGGGRSMRVLSVKDDGGALLVSYVGSESPQVWVAMVSALTAFVVAFSEE